MPTICDGRRRPSRSRALSACRAMALRLHLVRVRRDVRGEEGARREHKVQRKTTSTAARPELQRRGEGGDARRQRHVGTSTSRRVPSMVACAAKGEYGTCGSTTPSRVEPLVRLVERSDRRLREALAHENVGVHAPPRMPPRHFASDTGVEVAGDRRRDSRTFSSWAESRIAIFALAGQRPPQERGGGRPRRRERSRSACRCRRRIPTRQLQSDAPSAGWTWRSRRAGEERASFRGALTSPRRRRRGS